MVVRGILAILVILLSLSVTGCASPREQSRDHDSTKTAQRVMNDKSRQRLFAGMQAQLTCDSSDELVDDLTSYDSMLGVDCYSHDESTFLRVYTHSQSVNQALQHWEPTLVQGRSVVRGQNWFLIGPARKLQAVKPVRGEPIVSRAVGEPVPPTSDEANVTTCVQFMSAWMMMAIQEPEAFRRDVSTFDSQISGAGREIREIVTDEVVARVVAIPDEDRRLAALTSSGPRLKKFCRLQIS